MDKSKLNDVNSGKVYIEIENGMPLEVGLTMRLLGRTGQSVLLLPQSGQPLAVAAARVDGEGKVMVPAERTSVIELNRADVEQFNPAEFLTYAVSLATTPGSSAVRFKTSDFIRVRIWSTFSYRVK